ncbi:hypothetical protein TSTA_008250, partial [Talaromyces stipitatus ATCC 10500]
KECVGKVVGQAEEWETYQKLISKPSKSTLQYWMYLCKARPAILIQLRTERVGLGHYLWRIKKHENPYCECGLSGQSVKHALLDCPLYADERELMWAESKDSVERPICKRD